MTELLLAGALISGLIGALIAPRKDMGSVAGFSVGALFGIFGLAWLALRPSTSGADHPGCVPCGAFATHTIAGQPLCEDHARSAVKVGWQAEPIR